MKWRSLVLSLSLVAAGCSTGSTQHAGSATQPASPFPVQVPPETAPVLPNSDSLNTTLTPLEAAQGIAKVFVGFGFGLVNPPRGVPNQLFTGGGAPLMYGIAGDYFSAKTDAKTAMDEDVVATCRWVRDGETRVLVRSNLPVSEHAKVMDRIRATLAAAATQPATSDKATSGPLGLTE